MKLSECKVGKTYSITQISGSEKLKIFLHTLGCHDGQRITLINILGGNYVVNIKDSRFALDSRAGKSIELAEFEAGVAEENEEKSDSAASGLGDPIYSGRG